MNSTTISNIIYLRKRYNYSWEKIAELTGTTKLQVQHALSFIKASDYWGQNWRIPENFYPGIEAYIEKVTPQPQEHIDIIHNLQVITHILYQQAIKQGRRKRV